MEDENMNTLTLDEIENRVKKNSIAKDKAISEFEKVIQTRNLKKGRIRSKNPVEERILASFKRK